VLAASGKPRRSLRFALWSGEEQGLIGSLAYVAAHAAELPGCIAVLNSDNGAGHVRGWKAEGRKDVRAALAPLARGLLAGMGAGTVEMTLTPDTDHFSFVIAGIPALDLLVDPKNYEVAHHKAADTVDKVDAHDLASGAAVLAVTAYALSNQTESFAPHLDHAGIEALLKEDGLDELLRAFNLWK
jgi:carboxypeptidase Q